MTVEQQIANLRKELKAQKTQEQNLTNWLYNHFDSPLRIEVIGDLNALTVKIKTTEFKICNLERNRPLLGDEIPESTNQQENQETKKRKTI
jgi:hypothetical protein